MKISHREEREQSTAPSIKLAGSISCKLSSHRFMQKFQKKELDSSILFEMHFSNTKQDEIPEI